METSGKSELRIGVAAPLDDATGETTDREARKAAKRAAKEQRIARAADPEHCARKHEAHVAHERAEQAREQQRCEREASYARVRARMRREAMGEVDTDGETDGEKEPVRYLRPGLMCGA